ncbi:glycosyl transferase group 1 [Oscillochloris trichoides DG-6]|uniref:Glycosyl transferase group 1 n=1 Tax=Oscillochloris trichoides DG-6 TaxID=765420 RepID=E1IBV1_9CHLR|nr:glycosyltransferase family 4 protein [Oscillochloris trichoides]EFO81331.1 glycosyl transferase group 1 [Oscillochloris trichoides DG-6]
MRLLYIAAGIPVPGALGGSTHAYEVARGLARLGHAVHLVAAGPARRPRQLDGFTLYQRRTPKALSLADTPFVFNLARHLRPDAIIERYYNFAGAGMLAARWLGIPSLLEVNALMVDPPAVRKRRLDDRLGGPMRRYAERQCDWAARIVTPLHTTVPARIARSKIVEMPWGADVDRFDPTARQPQSGPPNIVFMGSFRAWHGVTDGVRAVLRLLDAGHDLRMTLIGDGPERSAAEALAAPHRERFHFSGAIPYSQIPAELARADLGIAPFNTAPHPALRSAGFFWSPLKIYEYMAAGLPVVTAAIPPLDTIIREGQEGALYPEGDVAALDAAIARVLADPAAAQAMGQRARERVVAHYSWQQHCRELERVLGEML